MKELQESLEVAEVAPSLSLASRMMSRLQTFAQMESERADEAEKANSAYAEELKALRPTPGQKAAAAVGGMMSIFQRPQAQKPDEELIATVEDMNAAVDAANMAKNALNSALIETVAQGSLSMS